MAVVGCVTATRTALIIVSDTEATHMNPVWKPSNVRRPSSAKYTAHAAKGFDHLRRNRAATTSISTCSEKPGLKNY